MLESDLTHPQEDQLLIVRKSFIEICNNFNAGVLLSYFEYWHNINKKPLPHTRQEIYDECMGILNLTNIDDARKILKKLNFITEHKNPNKRYSFDNTKFYKLEVENVNKKIDEYIQKIQNKGE